MIGYIKNEKEKGYYNHYDSYPSWLLRKLLVFIKERPEALIKEFAEDIFKKLIEEFDLRHENFDFIYDSLFCEYAYIFNYDKETLEIYKGFNKDPKEAGKYASKKIDKEEEYFGSRLLLEIPFGKIHQLDPKTFSEMLDHLCHYTSLKKTYETPTKKEIDNLIKNYIEIEKELKQGNHGKFWELLEKEIKKISKDGKFYADFNIYEYIHYRLAPLKANK